jgi:hypothetical protein
VIGTCAVESFDVSSKAKMLARCFSASSIRSVRWRARAWLARLNRAFSQSESSAWLLRATAGKTSVGTVRHRLSLSLLFLSWVGRIRRRASRESEFARLQEASNLPRPHRLSLLEGLFPLLLAKFLAAWQLPICTLHFRVRNAVVREHQNGSETVGDVWIPG